MFHGHMLCLSNRSYTIGFFFISVPEEPLSHVTNAGGSIQEDVAWFILGGTDRLRLGRA